LVAADAQQPTRTRIGVDALTFVVGEKHGGSSPVQERGQFRHGQYNTAIVVAAIGVAAIGVAAIEVALERFQRRRGELNPWLKTHFLKL
jgi:hypothetical protein